MSNEVSIIVRARDASGRVFERATARAERLEGKLEQLRTKGMAPLGTAALSLGPAIIPVLAAATAGALATGAAFAGAGAALGVFGAVAKGAMTEIKEQDTALSGLRDKMALYGREAKLAAKAGDSATAEKMLKKQAAAALELKARLSLLPTEQRKATIGYGQLKDAWQGFVDKNKPAVFGIFAKGFDIVKRSISSLQPLFDVGAKAVAGFLDKAGEWQSGGGLKSMIDFLAKQGSTALPILGRTFANIGSGLGQIFKVAGGSSAGALGVLERLSKAFSNWAAGDSFTNFMNYAVENAPKVGQLLGSLAANVATLVQVFTPFAPLSLAVAGALSAILNAIPVGVLQTMVGIWVAYSLAMRAYSTATLIAIGYTKLLAGAARLMSFALTANPIGLVVLALVALVAGLTIAYQKSQTFRQIVREAFSTVGMAVINVIQFMLHGYQLWSSGLLLAVQLILNAIAKVPGPTQKAAKAAAESFEGFRRGVDNTFNKVNATLDGYKNDLRNMPKMKLEADIRSWNEKIAAAKAKLKTVPASKQAKIKADIAQLQSQVRKAQAELNKVKSKNVYINVTTTKSTRIADNDKATGGIQGAASGGSRSGWTMVGEAGRELVKLAPGSSVKPNGATERMMAGGGGGASMLSFDVIIGGKSLGTVLVDVLRGEVRGRGGNVQVVLGKA